MQIHEIEQLLKFSELSFFVSPHKDGGFLINVTLPDGDFQTLRTQRGPVRVFKTLDSAYSVLIKLGVESFEVSK
jgi:hypothetical protein